MRVPASVEERTHAAQARVGQTLLGTWRLERLLAVGGMAAVFEASLRGGSRVAIKVLHSDLTGFEHIRERFLSEGYAANRVAHPGVVTVRDEGTTEDGAVFLVMDLLRGQTLAERLAISETALSLAEVLEISAQLLDVLAHAHSRGVVHGDIKPDNIFLTHDGRVRLLDFGIARVESAAHTQRTRAGSTLGTPAFMPPEQALGEWTELDGRSDLWSLGATMFLLLSGRPVREPASATEVLLRAMTNRVPSLADVTLLPGSVVAVVDRALAFDRDARFPDAHSMQLALRALREELRRQESWSGSPPPSLVPVALSVRTPYPDAPSQRGPTPTMRPVTATTTGNQAPTPARHGLLLYMSLGFAVGLGLVIAARLGVQAPPPGPAIEPERAFATPPTTSALPCASSGSPKGQPGPARTEPCR